MTNKIAIVTGGSRGIGRSAVESLARRRVDTIFTYHSHAAEAETVAAAAKQAGANAVAASMMTLGPGAVRQTARSCKRPDLLQPQALQKKSRPSGGFAVSGNWSFVSAANFQRTEQDLHRAGTLRGSRTGGANRLIVAVLVLDV